MEEIEQLTTKDIILNKITQHPLQTVKECFKTGSVNDLNIFLSFLPKLFRYLRIPEVMHNSLPSLRKPTAVVNVNRSQYNLGPGASLISRLYYNEEQLKSRDIKQLFDSFISSMNYELQTEVESVLINRREFKLPREELSYMDKRRKRIFYVMMALDKLIRRKEQFRVRGSNYEHLIDQIIQPQNDYLRGMPITYSVLYCSLINSLDIDLEAYGIPFPKHFLSRIIVKNYANADDSMLQLEQNEFSGPTVDSLEPSNFTWHDASKYKEAMNIHSLTGSWICCTDTGFSEFQITYNKEKMRLEANLVNNLHDSDDTKHHWYLEMKKMSNIVTVGDVYSGVLIQENKHPQEESRKDTNSDVNVTSGNESIPPATTNTFSKMKDCTIEIFTLPSAVLGSPRKGTPSIRGPYYEIQIRFRSDDQVTMEPDQIHHYCRTIDLDWCLLDISDQGIVPITPMHYITSLQK
jgi:hypothetical protein